MIRISKLGLCSFIVGALALSGTVAQAQAQSRAYDANLAKKGAKVFEARGCATCHSIRGKGGQLAGPDLAHVTERRNHDWLMRWMKDPTAMFGSDSIADAMLIQYKNVKMPNLKLSDSDIDALMNYFRLKAATITRRDE